jgi:hypothetical protein
MTDGTETATTQKRARRTPEQRLADIKLEEAKLTFEVEHKAMREAVAAGDFVGAKKHIELAEVAVCSLESLSIAF